MILLLSLTDSGRAAQLDDAVAAAHRGEYAVAFQLTSPLAENGDARAQFNIGYMYANGWGVQPDLARAVNWYRKAAEQGLEIAQHYIGIAYINGDGIERDDAEAARWFKRAAEQGFSRAQLMLGRMYLDGRGVPKDLVQGYAWAVLAGRRGAPTRVSESLSLTPQQLAQAEEIMGRWKPKPESSLTSVADPRPEEIMGLDAHVGEFADPGTGRRRRSESSPLYSVKHFDAQVRLSDRTSCLLLHTACFLVTGLIASWSIPLLSTSFWE